MSAPAAGMSMLTPMYMVVSMHLLWAGANGANLVVDEAVAAGAAATTAHYNCALAASCNHCEAEKYPRVDEPMLLHAPFAGTTPPWLHAQRTTQEWG